MQAKRRSPNGFGPFRSRLGRERPQAHRRSILSRTTCERFAGAKQLNQKAAISNVTMVTEFVFLSHLIKATFASEIKAAVLTANNGLAI
jgi:hypothetical protein